MKPLQEETEIERIFKIAKSLGMKVPEMTSVEFYTSGFSNGRANETILQICCNYPGEMNCKNARFVGTVCHELVHYNGEMNHGKKFWQGCDWLTAQVLQIIEKEDRNGNNSAQVNENSETCRSRDSSIRVDEQKRGV